MNVCDTCGNHETVGCYCHLSFDVDVDVEREAYGKLRDNREPSTRGNASEWFKGESKFKQLRRELLAR